MQMLTRVFGYCGEVEKIEIYDGNIVMNEGPEKIGQIGPLPQIIRIVSTDKREHTQTKGGSFTSPFQQVYLKMSYVSGDELCENL